MGIIEQLGGLGAIREKVSCPEFGDNYYGEWGALTLTQRRTIAALVARVDYLDKLCRAMQNANPDSLWKRFNRGDIKKER